MVEAQGPKKGEQVTTIGGPIEVVHVHRERVERLTDDPVYRAREVALEGLDALAPLSEQFVGSCLTHGCQSDDLVTRAEFRDLEQGQQADGSVVIPEALRRYTGFDRLVPRG